VNDWLNYVPIEQLPILKDEPLADFFWHWLTNSNSRESYWQELNPCSYLDSYDLPALHIGGWADIFIEATVNAYLEVQQYTQQPQHLLIAPYEHFPWSAQVGDRHFGKQAESHIDELQIAWFDFWLKDIDNGIIQQKPVQLFLMGANHFVGMEQFPHQPNFLYLYLHDRHQLKLIPQLEPSLPHTFVYDPKVPTPTTAYSFLCQSALTRRWDILLYESAPLAVELTIMGFPEMVLYGQTNLKEWDWVIRLLDIDPTGGQLLVCMGVLHCQGEQEMVAQYLVRLRPTCHQFAVGHKIGLAIASGAFPMISRAGIDKHSLDMEAGTQQVYHSGEFCSLIKLPLAPARIYL
jgi:putative CocE/NonD family hydrolase